MALWYNPGLTIKALEDKGVTKDLFSGWINLFDKFNDGWELRRNLFGLSSILKLNIPSLPDVSRLKKFFVYQVNWLN